jgi:uncharacterized protein YqfA (UPF0365 family)
MDVITGAGIVGFIFLIFFLIMFMYFVPLGLWITALSAGVHVRIFSDLVGMRLRKVPPGIVVRLRITAAKAGLPISIQQIETHYLAGGKIDKVVYAMIEAEKAQIHLPWERATAIDLAGRDLKTALDESITPKVITTANVSAVAKNGIQLRATARVTVRTNLDRLVGGAGDQTILARVGEGIVSTIGAAETHKEVLEYPDRISKTVLAKGLDAGTAFEILSIDVYEVEVGENIGAKLQADQAEADLKIARAKAEERRAAAIALEQEMKARVQEMQAKVVESEAQVPIAMAQAFRDGNLGVMDYYNFKNIQADTSMRQSIATSATPQTPSGGQQPPPQK